MLGYGLVGLLKLVEASGGSIDTRIRIQKEAFLLSLKGYPHFRGHTFKYHHFGPFSREISDLIQSAVAAGLLVEREEKYTDGRRYTYEITEAGRALTKDKSGSSDELSKYVDVLRNQHWRALELAATVAYLESRNKAATRDEAFAMAKKLKPETTPFTEGAEEILAELRV
jgi:uncharacterized protein YwgA